MNLLAKIAFCAAIILPFWNTPLILRVIKRRSSKDISLYWAFGVWTCLLLMLPRGLTSSDGVFKAFTISNFFLFSITVTIVTIYHKEKS